MTITTDINKIQIPEWDSFIKKHPNGTVFQSYSMYLLFQESKNFKPIFIVAKSNGKIKGVLLAVIIKEYSSAIGFFSSRTVIYGGPLMDNSVSDTNNLLDQLLKELIHQVGKKSIFIQFRNFFDWGDQKTIFLSNGFTYLERLNYLVDTSSAKEVKTRMSNSKLRQVNKALKTGAKIIQPENLEQVNQFYDILYDLYKKKVKKPLPDKSFFESFYQESKKGQLGILLLVLFNNKVIGGILSPIIQNKTIYEWYICGLDKEYKNCYPSVLATWAAIDYATKNNIKYFDFMGVGVPDRDYGVRNFKQKFGGDMVSYGRYGRINNKFLYSITEIGYNILSGIKKI